jgi:hypothetical protein
VLITPEIFRNHPQSRLYGWLMRDYQQHPAALRRDLPHRTGTDFASVASRLGWLSWEDCNRVLPGACPWLLPPSLFEHPAAELSVDDSA